MKLALALTAFAGVLVLAGCDGPPTPTQLSLEPVVTDADLISVEGLTGAWQNGDDVLILRLEGESKKIGVAYVGGGEPLTFDALPFRVGDALFLDVTPGNDDDFRIAGHAVARIWLENGEFRWCFLGSDWLNQQVGTMLTTYQVNGKVLVLSPGSAMRAVLAKFGSDEKAYGRISTWQRLK